MSLAERGEKRLHSAMEPFSDPVPLRVVRRRVVQLDLLFVAELLELCTGELASVVQDNTSRWTIISDVPPHSLCNLGSVFCGEGKEPDKPAIVIHYSESIPVPMTACYL